MRAAIALVLLAALAIPGAASAAPGDVDLTFSATVTDGSVKGRVRTMVVQPNGQMLIGGDFNAVNGQPRLGIARLNPDGSLDQTFSSPLLNGASVRAIHLSTDGTILIGGWFYIPGSNSTPVWRLVTHLSPSGSVADDIDLTSPHFLNTNDVVNTILVEPSGEIVIGGTFYYLRDVYTPGLARLSSAAVNGIVALGSAAGLAIDRNGVLRVQSIARQPLDGKLIVGGQFGANGGKRSLIRTLSDGNIDGTFTIVGTDYDERVNSVAIESTGQILVSGNFTRIGATGAYRMARLNPDGTVDANHAPLDLSGIGAPLSMAVQADGRILLGGILGPINNTTRYGIARFNTDFSLDSFYPNPDGVNGEVWSIGLQGDGRVVIGGLFDTVGGVSRTSIARLVDATSTNSAPELTNLSATPAVDEGNSATVTGSVSDTDAADQLTLSIDWGDGSAATVATYSSGANFSHSHTYTDDPPSSASSDDYTINVSLADGNGGSASGSAAVTVNNVAPTLSALAVSPSTITAGGSTTLTGTIGDPGVLDAHSAVVDWGDGTTSTVNLAAGGTALSSSHSYAAQGTFVVGVSLSDDDSGSTSGTVAVTVDPVPPSAPAAPTNLNAIVTSSRVGKTRVYSGSLTWTDNSDNESSFIIQRFVKVKKSCAVDSAFGTVSVSAGTTSFVDSTATSATCGYQVAAHNDVGDSAFIRDMNVNSGVTR